jgi:hypothetical protein
MKIIARAARQRTRGKMETTRYQDGKAIRIKRTYDFKNVNQFGQPTAIDEVLEVTDGEAPRIEWNPRDPRVGHRLPHYLCSEEELRGLT